MGDLITIRRVLETALPVLVETVGERRARSIGRRASDLMGAGGSTEDWMKALGVAAIEDSEAAGQAYLRIVRSLAGGVLSALIVIAGAAMGVES